MPEGHEIPGGVSGKKAIEQLRTLLGLGHVPISRLVIVADHLDSTARIYLRGKLPATAERHTPLGRIILVKDVNWTDEGEVKPVLADGEAEPVQVPIAEDDAHVLPD